MVVMIGQSICLDHEKHTKDFGVILDENLDFSVHIAEKSNKAYSILG